MQNCSYTVLLALSLNLYHIKNVILIIQEQSNWIPVASRKECDDSEKFNIAHAQEEGIKTVDDCANICIGTSSMFAFGAKGLGRDELCNEIGCRCLCEISASEDGTCKEVNIDGYRLYKFRRFGKGRKIELNNDFNY